MRLKFNLLGGHKDKLPQSVYKATVELGGETLGLPLVGCGIDALSGVWFWRGGSLHSYLESWQTAAFPVPHLPSTLHCLCRSPCLLLAHLLLFVCLLIGCSQPREQIANLCPKELTEKISHV